MDDLISRQAAIEALDGKLNITGRENAETVIWYMRMVKDRLERLPSVQPEPLKITIDHAPTPDELERLKQAMRNTPVMLLPSAQPERKKGRWVNINGSEKYQCSECGITMWFMKSLDLTPDTYIFCPHCGAEMTEEKKKSGRTNHERTNKGNLC